MSSNTVNNKSIASETKFEEFCKLCDKIESKKSKNDKKSVLIKFINWWRNKSKDTNDNIYPALRLLCPYKDTKIFSPPLDEAMDESNSETLDQNVGRSAYGLKVDKLRQNYIKILNLSRESDDAKKLLNFNKSKENVIKDFANVLFEIMSSRSRVRNGIISIEELNAYLDRMSIAFEEKRVKDGEEVLTELIIKKLTPLENKWLVRIVLKDMHLGIGDNTILNTYHSDAVDYYETNHNLYKVCVDLMDPNQPLSVISVQLFSPFSPMLSERVKLKSINRIINNKQFLIEVKYDGERFQIHKRLNQFKYFSRNCNDFSEAFNETLTPFIGNAFDNTVNDCILDGEMMGYEEQNNRLVFKSEHNFDVKHMKKEDIERHPLYVVFDILYLNGEVLTGKTVIERKEILERIIKPIDSRLRLAEKHLSETKEEIIEAMNAAIDKREEGIIVKLCDSVYKLNKRQGGGWLKLKPDYIDGLMDELDLLIIGGLYGSRGISHFILALKDTDDNNPQKFFSICSVGTGYSDEELRELQNKLKNHWKKFDRKKCPPFLEFGKQKPDIWIEPKNSVVLQIKAAEIIECSGDYRTSYTLRFPRVMKIKTDKEWYQCMSFAEMEGMKANGSLANRLEDDGIEEPERKRRKQMERPTVSSLNKLVDDSNISFKSKIFDSKEICVLQFKDPSIKQFLEKMILENGGQICGFPRQQKTFCIIAENCDTIAVKRFLINSKYDVIKQEWIQRCVNENKLLNWTPSDIWSQTNETKKMIDKDFDRFGDSYTQDIYETELKELFEKITDLSGIEMLSNQKIADIEFEYWPNDREFSFFRTIKVLVDKHESSDKLLVKLIESQMRFYGATIVSDLVLNPTHIVVFSQQRNDVFKQINRQNVRKFHIVSQNWVQKCIEVQKEVDFFDVI